MEIEIGTNLTGLLTAIVFVTMILGVFWIMFRG